MAGSHVNENALLLIFRDLGRPNTMQTMFKTLPLVTSAFTSCLTGAFDSFCNFH